MNRFRFSRAFFAGVPTLGLLLASAPLAAPADDDGTQPADPGVARVSVMRGSVDIKRADSGDTVSAAINAPLSEGDYLSTQDDSHAEVQFDYGTNLRVGADTQLRFTQLAPQDHELQLAAGTVELRVFRGLNANAQIETPQATIRADENGSTIVNVDDDGNTQVTLRSGSADVVSQSGTQTLQPGSTLEVTGDADDVRVQTIAAVSYGDFESWIASRDRAFTRVADYRYVDADMVGAQDLDGNGSWVENPQYGRVWVPTVPVGWAPYHDGRWVWEPYYGWTWVDREPWGWAPFHYGNWFYAAGTGWAWYPGASAVAQPYVYRPALVAFFNFGGGASLSIGFGNVGWVPIAPYEPFHPWWSGRGGNTTIVNNYNITKVYRNAGVPGGANGVANGNFQNGNFKNVRVLESNELTSVQPVRSVVPIVPSSRNLAFGGHPVTTPIAPVARFSAFHTPLRRSVPSFAAQQATVQENATRDYPTHAETFVHPLPLEHPSTSEFAPPARVYNAGGNPFGRFARPSTQGPSATGAGASTTPDMPATAPVHTYRRPSPIYGDSRPYPNITTVSPTRGYQHTTPTYSPTASHIARPIAPRVRRPRPRPTPPHE